MRKGHFEMLDRMFGVITLIFLPNLTHAVARSFCFFDLWPLG